MSDDEKQGEERSEHDVTLAEWSEALANELGLAGLDVDVDAILSLAGTAAHAVVRPAAPLTTFLVGYAAGRAAALGETTAAAATERASNAAAALARRRAQ
ncbi:DUF6457 domain-containing protein [Agreia sp. COWG]|uniref:DUF6457 domain-containing protein n=1 Tax=Agreia sp. COWG TaxID=2773266 RepID=UPI0019289947|nr:DUF6457 domain-containing protein [Agreia sp. COWG]CAD6007945.1 protein of unknown function [Agreia sp. COWG]